eukprot:3713305-Pyramimonas_sp.AAC.1
MWLQMYCRRSSTRTARRLALPRLGCFISSRPTALAPTSPRFAWFSPTCSKSAGVVGAWSTESFLGRVALA